MYFNPKKVSLMAIAISFKIHTAAHFNVFSVNYLFEKLEEETDFKAKLHLR